jgi:hypothetical protein
LLRDGVAWQVGYPNSDIQSFPALAWHIPQKGGNLGRSLLSYLELYSPKVETIFHQLEERVYIAGSVMSPGPVVAAMSPYKHELDQVNIKGFFKME